MLQPPYKADLKNPDQTIVVSVVKGFCAISVVPKFRQLAKFNFKELSVMEDKKDEASKNEIGEAATKAKEDGDKQEEEAKPDKIQEKQ